jgi:hypothetical protein
LFDPLQYHLKGHFMSANNKSVVLYVGSQEFQKCLSMAKMRYGSQDDYEFLK